MKKAIKTVRIYTNLIWGGWSYADLETGIGGSEEKLIEFARELQRDSYDVTIYHNGVHGDFEGVHYRDHSEFKPWERSDIFISFKTRHILENHINSGKIIHWTTEVEPSWYEYELESIDHIVAISDYHKRRLNTAKAETKYLWFDKERMDNNKAEKVKGTMLYASSYDRGLEELLRNWDLVKDRLGIERLYITYGWDFLDAIIKHNPQLQQWKRDMEGLLQQEGIHMQGRVNNDAMCKLYWQMEYWCLPLSNPDSELFCMNAVKAQYAEAIPVVRCIGALTETVNDFIEWDQLCGQKVSQSSFDTESIQKNKEHALTFTLDKQIAEWKRILT